MNNPDSKTTQRSAKTQEEWRALLDPEQYAVLFEEATERPFLMN